MTTYFDNRSRELRDIERVLCGGETTPAQWQAAYDKLAELDSRVVRDVTIAAESPGMPPPLARRIHEIVLRCSVTCQPLNGTGPDFETIAGHCGFVRDLIECLHSTFHDVGRSCARGFSDSPIAPLNDLFARGEEARERMAAETNPWQLWRRGDTYSLLLQSNTALRSLLGPEAALVASFYLVSKEDAVRAKHAFLGLPEPTTEELYD